MSEKQDKIGDLRVWWIPQVPMKPFYVDVSSIEEGAKVLDTLARYDQFQLDNNIKPDYCNTGGLVQFVIDGGEGYPQWIGWEDEETGEDDVVEFLKRKAA